MPHSNLSDRISTLLNDLERCENPTDRALLRETVRLIRDTLHERDDLQRAVSPSDSFSHARQLAEHLALALKAGHSGIFDWDAKTNTNNWSPELLDLYGLKPEEFGGRYEDWIACLVPEDRENGAEAVRRSLVTGEFTCEFRIRRRDNGETRWMHGRGQVFFDNSGNPTRMAGINVDISERKRAEESARQSHATVQAFYDASPFMMGVVELHGDEIVAIHANKKVANFFGITPDALKGQRGTEINPTNDVHVRWANAYRESLENAAPVHFEYEHPTANGVVWISATVAQLEQGDHPNPRFSFVAEDVTERKHAETALRESERRFRSTFEQAAVGIAHLDLNGRWLRVNQRYCQIIGYDIEELQTLTFQDITHPDDLEADVAQARRLQSGEIETYSIDKRYIRKDGSAVWVTLTASMVRDDEGRPLYYIAIAEDINEKKIAQEGMRRSSERWALLAGTAAELLVSREPQQVVEVLCLKVTQHLGCDVFFNFLVDDAGERLHLNACCGVTKEQALAASELRMGEAVCGCVAQSGARIIATDIQNHGDSRTALVASLGIQAYACHPLLAADERVIGTLSFGSRAKTHFSDDEVALMKAVADQVAVAMERQRAETALRVAKQAAEQANHAKDHFLAVLSHELRTPLTPVVATAQLLTEDNSLSPQQHEMVQMMRRNVELEARLIDDLLDLTRITRGKLALHLADADVHEKIRHVMGMCDEEITARNLDVMLRLKAKNHYVHADPARLQQVIWNIVKNAAKFTAKNGRITITTQDDPDGKLVIEIADTGVGISPEFLPRVFDAFEQGDARLTQQFGGLGLGLAISKALVEMHGGTITAASQGKGEGSTFTVKLTSMARPRAMKWPEARNADAAMECSVLLVEDHPDTRKIMARILAGIGCHVLSAGTVAEALELAASRKFDLLVSDIGLPDGSGLDLMREVKKLYGLTGIALSGYGMDSDVTNSKMAGFVVHLTKPVNIQLLEETVRQLIDGA